MEEPEDQPAGPSDLAGRRRFLARVAGGSLLPWLVGPAGSIAGGGSQDPAVRRPHPGRRTPGPARPTGS